MGTRDRTSEATFLVKYYLLAVLTTLCAGCATGHLGTFSETTFFDRSEYTNFRALGPVQGENCQTMVLYVFPYQSPPSTVEAMHDALAKYENAVFLGNVAVERHQKWLIGYSRICTMVTGTAYTADRIEE